MSVITDIKTGLRDLAAKAEGLDEAAVSKLEAISANPGAVEVMDALFAVLHVPANGLTIFAGLLKDLGTLWEKPAVVPVPVVDEPMAAGLDDEPLPA